MQHVRSDLNLTFGEWKESIAKKTYLSGPTHSPYPTVPVYDAASLRRNSSCWISAIQSMKRQKFPGIKHLVGKHIQSYEGSYVELSQSAIHWQPTSLSSISISYTIHMFVSPSVFFLFATQKTYQWKVGGDKGGGGWKQWALALRQEQVVRGWSMSSSFPHLLFRYL